MLSLVQLFEAAFTILYVGSWKRFFRDSTHSHYTWPSVNTRSGENVHNHKAFTFVIEKGHAPKDVVSPGPVCRLTGVKMSMHS